MSRRRIALAVAAALLALGAGWYWGSPWWTLWRIREAARAGDLARVASYVDVATIEADTKAELKQSWGSVLALDRGRSETARRFVAFARRQLAKVDEQSRFRFDEMRPWLSDIFGAGIGDPYIVHRGLDRFELRYRGSSPEYGPVLTFRRHGLGWKLAGVRPGQQ